MKEENKGVTKIRNWKRIFRKKWFFPALYLTVAALLLAAVVWYQTTTNQTAQEDQAQEENTPVANEEDTIPVMEQSESIGMPVANEDQAEIVTTFYDYNNTAEEQENALILYNNRYYQSTGVDIASGDGETFDVTASLTGTVEEVKEDPLLGNMVVLSSGSDVKTYYAALDQVNVQAGDEVSQGDVIGNAGQNLFGKDNGIHVHFELRKNDTPVDPEEYFNQPVTSLEEITEETAEEANPDEGSDEGTEGEESTEGSNTQESAENEGNADDANAEESTDEQAPTDEPNTSDENTEAAESDEASDSEEETPDEGTENTEDATEE